MLSILNVFIMTYRTRRFLFWLCIVFFALAAIPLILYASGWRFVWKEKILVRTGGLFIASFPSTETKIFVDDTLRKETSLISRSLFLGQLSPGIHQVRVAREGYHEWSKTIFVEPELVAELRAILVPQVPQAYQVLRDTSLTSVFYASKEETIVFQDTSKQWYRLDRESQTLAPMRPLNILPEKSEEDTRRGRRLSWDTHEVWVYWNDQYLPHYQTFEAQQILQTPYDIRSVAFYPRREAVLVALSNAVMVVELDGRGRRNITPLYKGKEPSFAVDASARVMYILDDGTLIRIPLQ